MSLYTRIFKPVFFRMDPEYIHDRAVNIGSILGKFYIAKRIVSALCSYKDKILEQNILGINFVNPIGLAAGFDKNAELIGIMPHVGFGHVEVGSITNLPCVGNPKPRLWRLKNSKGLIVYYGLKNDGVETINKRLQKDRSGVPISTSIAMTNCKDNLDIQNAIKDYTKSFQKLKNTAEIFTINVSCPNTEGGQPFMDPIKMDLLLSELDKIETKKPIFIKLSPDIEPATVDKILDILHKHRVNGIICSNLTKNRNNPNIKDVLVIEKGGISGKPVQEISDNLLSYIYKKERGRYVLVGCGGVFGAEDAYKKIRLGASLVQLITGMIFEGPQVIGDINKGLAKMLERDGFRNISEAVGVDIK